jgi:methyl-accepting chemotaxis protein
MTKKRVEIELDIADRDAQRQIKDINKELGRTEDAFADAESAGKQMARVIDRTASDMITELDDTKRAVDALERALGDLEADPTALVADLKRVGLTAQDIEDDAEELAAALRRAGDVKIKAKELGFDDVDQALGRTTDNSRVASTAIGGIGNSISELPGIGSLGPVAESMGMLAENALEGEANLKGLVVAGAGLAALGGTMAIIEAAMSSMADTKAFHTEQVESFRDAINETAEGLSAVNEHFREAQEIAGRAGGLGSFFEKTKEITDQLIDAGVSYDEWVDGVEQGGEALDSVTKKLTDHRDGLVDARNEALRNGDATIDLERGISDMNNAVEIARETYNDFSTALNSATRTNEWMAQSTRRTTAEVEELAEKLAGISGEHDGRITFDTLAANSALDELINKLDSAGIKASQLSIVAANRFNTGAGVTVIAPAGTDINQLARQNFRRTGTPAGAV